MWVEKLGLGTRVVSWWGGGAAKLQCKVKPSRPQPLPLDRRYLHTGMPPRFGALISLINDSIIGGMSSGGEW